MAVQSGPTQLYQDIAVSCVLDQGQSESLLLSRVSITEGLGQLFEFELELISVDHEIKLDDILGHGMTVRLETPAGETRYFNGIASRFSHTGSAGRYATYRATLRPWLWLLTRSAGCRIFQQESVPDIIKKVLGDHGFTEIDHALYGTYSPLEYCVQYRETDFNFVARLMEQEGIYYNFQHDNGSHTMVLCDSSSSHSAVPGYEQVPFYPPDPGALRERDCVSRWSVSQEVQSGVCVLNDYDFERPKADIQVAEPTARQHIGKSLQVYDYPGEYKTREGGERYAKIRIEELNVGYEIAQGEGNVHGFAPGALFELTNHPRADQNDEYLIVSTQYELQSNEYESGGAAHTPLSMAFTAIPNKRQTFRPTRISPKPIVQGPQTAVVVGKKGEEIWTDQYGRVMVQFHWDRYGESNEKSSCWVRVAQAWAGKAWGGIFIPRIGQEVIVEFLEGDPDRPIITGSVYNGDNMPPYALPANQTQSGVKSRSTKGGSEENFNEIRFEDLKDSELIYIQAEKDYEKLVKNDRRRKIGHDEKLEVGNDQTESIGANKSLSVGKNHNESIGDSATIEITKNDMWYKATTLVILVSRISSMSVDDEMRNVARYIERWGGELLTPPSLPQMAPEQA